MLTKKEQKELDGINELPTDPETNEKDKASLLEKKAKQNTADEDTEPDESAIAASKAAAAIAQHENHGAAKFRRNDGKPKAKRPE